MSEMFETRQYKLDNGLEVVMQRTPDAITAIDLHVWHGALHEKEHQRGLAHYIEHVVSFSPTHNRTKQQVEKAYQQLGSHNATTARNNTSYYAKMLPDRLEGALDLFADITFDTKMDEGIVEQERHRIKRELASARGSKQWYDGRALTENYFGKDSPFILDVGGSLNVVENAAVDDLMDCYKVGYNAANMTLFLVGNLPENIDELVTRYFGDRRQGTDNRFVYTPDMLPTYGGPRHTHTGAPELINLQNPEESNSQLLLLTHGPNVNESDHAAFVMMDQIFGIGIDSKLFQSVSRQKGLAYDIASSHNNGVEFSSLQIQGTVAQKRQEEAVDAIFDVCNVMQNNPCSPDELDRVADSYLFHKAKTALDLDSRIAEMQYVYEGFVPDAEFQEMFLRLTPQDVQQAAQKYLPTSRDEGNYVLMLRDPLKK